MNTTCSAEPCPIILNSSCVFYRGGILLYTGINSGDNLQTSLQKIDAKFQDASIGYIFNNGLVQSSPGLPVQFGGKLIQDTTIDNSEYLLSFTGTVYSPSFKIPLGTSTQFLKADGTLDETIYGIGNVSNISINPGYGISASISNPTTTPEINITNTAPDQTVVIYGGPGILVTGTYPEFTIYNTSLPSTIIESLSVSAPLQSTGGNNPNISIQQASTASDGYLSHTDWNIFNSKPTTLATLSDVTISSPISSQILGYNGTEWINIYPTEFSLPIASNSILGGVKIGGGISITTDGVISVSTNYQAPLSGTGFVKISGSVISYDNSIYYLASNPNSYISTIEGISAGGDLSGTYPNPSINTINGVTKSYYDPTSSIQTQLNSKLSISTAASIYLPLSGGTLSGDIQQPTSPVNGTSLINKNYVDNIIIGVIWVGSDTDSTTNITLSGEQTINGVTTSNSRVFVHGQTDQTQNGIYISSSGAWSRSSDASTSAQIIKLAILIEGGSNKGQQWVNTNSTITLGTTNITFGQNFGIIYGAGTGLLLSGTSFTIDSSYTATSSRTGYLSNTDWTTFNNKQAALGFTPYNATNPSNYISLTALSSTATGLTYTNTTGVFSLTSGYLIPTTASYNNTNWDTAYTNRITSLTTTGSSGSATLVSNTLNIPTYTLAGLGGISLTALSATTPLLYNNTTGVFSIQIASTSQSGYLSSTDWNTFNNKQAALSGNGVVKSTSGTISYISGTSSQFVKADGSLDSNTYLTSNQTISFAPSGDISSTGGSGSTSLTPTISVTKILGNTIPANASGVLTNNGSGGLSWASVSASQWTTSGIDIYYSTGRVSIGTSTATSQLSVYQSNTGPGTVSTSGTTVTGTGTQFTNTFKVGDTITISSVGYTISAIASDTSMTTNSLPTLSGQTYTLTGGNRFNVYGNGNIVFGSTSNMWYDARYGALNIGTSTQQSSYLLNVNGSVALGNLVWNNSTSTLGSNVSSSSFSTLNITMNNSNATGTININSRNGTNITNGNFNMNTGFNSTGGMSWNGATFILSNNNSLATIILTGGITNGGSTTSFYITGASGSSNGSGKNIYIAGGSPNGASTIYGNVILGVHNLGTGGRILIGTTSDDTINLLQVAGRTNLSGQVSYGGSTPTIAAGTGAGTSPTVSIVGTNNGGVITVTTGTLPSSSATLVTITYTGAFATGSQIILYPTNAATALLSGVSMVFTTGTTTTFTITSGTTALTAATTYAWAYVVTGY